MLKDNMWKGRRCFVVGGGPSLKDFDWSLLKNELWIALNAAWLFGNPTIAYTHDLRCLKHFSKKEYRERWHQLPIRVHKHDFQIQGNKNGGKFKGVIGLKASKGWGRSLETGLFKSNNSGVGGLNLAEILGANPIYLLGFDMKTEAGANQFHNVYPDGWRQKADVYKTFIKEFKRTRCFLRKETQVINLCPDSALDCFEKRPISDILK